jgi:hypothetical protein
MTLAGNFDAVIAGCAHVPQYGINVIDSPALYQVKIWHRNIQTFYRFNYPVVVHWECPSPPAVVRLFFLERPDLEPNTDPILTVDCFLATCASPGTYKGTSRWFWTVFLSAHWAGHPDALITAIHVQNWKTNVDSIGFVNYPDVPPG